MDAARQLVELGARLLELVLDEVEQLGLIGLSRGPAAHAPAPSRRRRPDAARALAAAGAPGAGAGRRARSPCAGASPQLDDARTRPPPAGGRWPASTRRPRARRPRACGSWTSAARGPARRCAPRPARRPSWRGRPPRPEARPGGRRGRRTLRGPAASRRSRASGRQARGERVARARRAARRPELHDEIRDGGPPSGRTAVAARSTAPVHSAASYAYRPSRRSPPRRRPARWTPRSRGHGSARAARPPGQLRAQRQRREQDRDRHVEPSMPGARRPARRRTRPPWRAESALQPSAGGSAAAAACTRGPRCR